MKDIEGLEKAVEVITKDRTFYVSKERREAHETLLALAQSVIDGSLVEPMSEEGIKELILNKLPPMKPIFRAKSEEENTFLHFKIENAEIQGYNNAIDYIIQIVKRDLSHALLGHVGKKIELSREELVGIIREWENNQSLIKINYESLADAILAHSASAHNLSREELVEIIGLTLSQLLVKDEPDKTGYTKAEAIADKILAHSASPKVSPDFVSWAKDHYWDSLEKDKGLIVKHIEDNFATGSIPKEAQKGMGLIDIVKIMRKIEPIDLNGDKIGKIYESQYNELAQAILDKIQHPKTKEERG